MQKITLLASFFFPLALMAQVLSPTRLTPPSQPPLPVQPNTNVAIPQQSNTSKKTVDSAELTENVTVLLKGSTATISDIDLSLSGIGPSFTADEILDQNHVINCRYDVKKTERGYLVSYSISFQINSKGTGSYMDKSITGTVICREGIPLVIVQNGPKQVQLTINKMAAQDDASKPTEK